MKVTYHIPTEQYGFVEVEMEGYMISSDAPSYESIKVSVMPSTSPELPQNEGLDHKSWNTALDGYMTIGSCPSDVYESMNDVQKNIMQEIKKSMKRLNPPEKR